VDKPRKSVATAMPDLWLTS